ncbi:RagB/SusD family nutrient uptake outer membrane protein [Mucilaginibacter boryungensis]|uniref:RagB/SusD family nutrient uptake outer membrane protein n=1 Tax=Mucilaginibacter boryungensis TaxID=768480 RepID=A0ABR9XEC0_9SPHI|nr:RagB/SusD family nutrient uptake outer membrane protein [Mucilaginibacter boryungensis]MBE9665742.1 RagB/SusD family nutrient uptake outer membrane protein [Mucilaginibacter boryungensis]
MKSIIKPIFTLLLICSALACKKDYLNKVPDDDLTLDQVFANHDYARNFLNNVYTALPQEYRMVDPVVNSNPFVGASDDMEEMYPPAFSNTMNDGSWNPTTNVMKYWELLYVGIRKANLYIENADKVPTDDIYTAADRTKAKGEAIFLRAFYHFLLMRIYGPIPIEDHSVALDFDFRSIRRDPIDKCAAFVVSECDKAAALLPDRITSSVDFGRPAKSVCLALKARVLLYMASPLWNGNPDYANLKNDNGTRLFPDFVASRWQDAATAAKACIDQAESVGHGLYTSATNDPIKNYYEASYLPNTKEIFFAYIEGVNTDHDVYSEPRGMNGVGFTLNGPTQDVVDDYEMANGTQPILGYTEPGHIPIINPASGYTETGFTAAADPKGYYAAGTSNMYVGRDPRFYASIHYSGEIWKPTLRAGGTALDFSFSGPDGYAGRNGGNYTKTGYLVRKAANPDFIMSPRKAVVHSFPFFKLDEQYLNYAEALNEAQGPVADVYKYVNLIRTRSGMPNLPAGLSKDDMRTRIWHERRIELFFEGFRYFDAHRWKIAEQTEGSNVYGLNILAGANRMDPNFYKRTVIEKRVFEKKHYLWPIQQSERDKNPNLVQNFGW